jgi:histidinol dehydrogenase
MQHHLYDRLGPEEIRNLLKRPSSDLSTVTPVVKEIFEEVAENGDRAVRSFTKRFDGSEPESIGVSPREGECAWESIPSDLRRAIDQAAGTIETFHRKQVPPAIDVETVPGVVCRREWRPIERVGLYVPGGSAPLLSTALMLGVPALLAGCRDIVLCTPPGKTGTIAPAVLAAAWRIGLRTLYKVGGAQAVAAMALGTETIPRVDKIFGPGNRYVTAAKALASRPPLDVAIDMLAGPTELLVIADEAANPRDVAADLLSQAEHGEDSQVVLISTSAELISRVATEVRGQLVDLPRSAIAAQALEKSFSLLVESLDQAIAFSNQYAPEHLILAVGDADRYAPEIMNAGSVFMGFRSSVVFGDYAAGTNHTLPTGGHARAAGGLTVESFMKPVFFQTVSGHGVQTLSPIVKTLARAEGLEAHARAAEIREAHPGD